ncbi:MAG: glycosyltransferase family 2 protein [Candidatus Electrothrix sp. MAN1_4]|nr:glycosyltransferase family 2 protein [Candidatus Electrothrix sp. MAN1_4]
MNKITAIIVTYNSQDVLPQCLDALNQQSTQADIIVVDAGSRDTAYVESYSNSENIQVIFCENIGFSRANNRGYQAISQTTKYILFLNPDAFLTKNALQTALTFLQRNKQVGCVGGRLLGFDQKNKCPTGLVDSTGVFRTWYGCWYDRSQGEQDTGQNLIQEDVPALCGAFLFCRQTMLAKLAEEKRHQAKVFDPDFFLYKEDIELCLRIRKSGWRLVYQPAIQVYHCRGWKKQREQVPYSQRLTATHSELILYKKHPSLYVIWALAKYVLVRWLKI